MTEHVHVVLVLRFFFNNPFSIYNNPSFALSLFLFNTLLLSVQTDDKEDHESNGAEENLKAARSVQTTSVMLCPLISSDQLAYWHLFKSSFCPTYDRHDDAPSR